jgi:glycosyltransferase involved in cell wall biosynthesis/GT2 family glycosyltransferase
MTREPPSVSIIINTLGRAELLSDCLRGLTGLEWPNVEVVVVNGPSDDQTNDILDQWAHRIKIGHCPEANLAKSRNVGLSLAAGEIIAFLDDDAVPHPSWLAALIEPYRDPSVGAVGGHTIGRLGSMYQARTTLCDRFGDPYFVSEHLDLTIFCQPGSWIYPSMLGTNSSVRRSAIEEIRGFDEVFSYYLDETDICLRLIDAGWKIKYAPNALIWHQFASSALRSSNMTRRSVHAIVRSHCYFINRHSTSHWTPDVAKDTADRLQALRRQWLGGNMASLKEGAIDSRHRAKLDREVQIALEDGFHLSQANAGTLHGQWLPASPPAFLAFAAGDKPNLTVAFVCRYFERENETGIPRWTKLLAKGLAGKGHQVHVIAETSDSETRIRYKDGYWKHEIQSDASDHGWLVERYGLPPDQAEWAASVYNHLPVLRSFNIDLLSFPIWDLEGVGCLDQSDLTVCMSLHTSYGLGAQFRPEWALRPLLRDAIASRMIAAENLVLRQASHLLANSRSIVAELSSQTGTALDDRTRYAVHGVETGQAPRFEDKLGDLVLFVGRFEKRKGIDIALSAFAAAAETDENLRGIFVGGAELDGIIDAALQARLWALIDTGRLQLRGLVARDELDALYRSADIALLPSRYESFGLVAAEALAAGCAVLGLNVGGIAEVVSSGVNGVLVDNDESAGGALAKAILNLRADMTTLRTMQQAARQSALRDFTIDLMTGDVERAFFEFTGAEV